jgi:hypothetical protein
MGTIRALDHGTSSSLKIVREVPARAGADIELFIV